MQDTLEAKAKKMDSSAFKAKDKKLVANDIAHGRKVLEQEIKGLQALADTLDDHFAQAVECISKIKGRVIVSGMGKSGHVARKIAATMASTGTPAHFVHPGEASHGDLGMITPDDAVIALSNSGETAELSDLIAYCKRFSIPLIAMVRRKESMLVDAADIPMVLPNTSEACITGAPTTSTTMMMALGDALAVALVERKGFSRDDFSVFHPGGKLGKAFIRVADLMHTGKEIPLVESDMLMSDALLAVTGKRYGCSGVLDSKGCLAGVITDGDLRRHMNPNLLSMKATEVMTKNPLTIRPQALAAEALAIMNEKRITSLFIVEDEKPIGILHIHDCLRAGIV
jgi:arabinose-5-phosphate isomerase